MTARGAITRASRILWTLLVLLGATTSDRVRAGEANLDPAFGTGGFVLSGSFREDVRDLAVLDDGGIVAVGRGGTPRATVWRYTVDGVPDEGFGIGGRVELPDTPSPYGIVAATTATGVAATPDGKLVVVAESSVLDLPLGDYDYVSAIFRLEASGALDPTFGSGGRVLVNLFPRRTLPAPGYETLWDVAVQPDGRIVAVGAADDSADSVLAIRLLPDGTLDPSFGSAGVMRTTIVNAVEARAVQLLPDGRILVAGWATPVRVGIGPLAGLLLRLDPDGSLDATFGNGGVVTSTAVGEIPGFVAMARDAAGRIIVTGTIGADRGEIVVQRYDPDGTLDPGFGTAGTVQYATASNVSSTAAAVTVKPMGQTLIVGWTETPHSDKPGVALLQLTSDGVPDARFTPSGFARIDLQGGYSQTEAMATLPDGHVVLGGGYSHIDKRFDAEAFVARLEGGNGLCGNGVVDPGEECDDGNALGFDCCSTGCRLDAIGSACDFDGQLCTFDTCDGHGVCTAGGPAAACRAVTEPLRAQLMIRRRSDGDHLLWKWQRGEFTDIDQFGFPAAFTQLTLCFYGAGSVVGELRLPVGVGWTGIPDDSNPTELRYRGKAGVTKVRLVEGGDGKAEIGIKGKGPGLGPPLPLPWPMPASVRLLNDLGECWGATYDTAATNGARGFSARGQ